MTADPRAPSGAQTDVRASDGARERPGAYTPAMHQRMAKVVRDFIVDVRETPVEEEGSLVHTWAQALCLEVIFELGLDPLPSPQPQGDRAGLAKRLDEHDRRLNDPKRAWGYEDAVRLSRDLKEAARALSAPAEAGEAGPCSCGESMERQWVCEACGERRTDDDGPDPSVVVQRTERGEADARLLARSATFAGWVSPEFVAELVEKEAEPVRWAVEHNVRNGGWTLAATTYEHRDAAERHVRYQCEYTGPGTARVVPLYRAAPPQESPPEGGA